MSLGGEGVSVGIRKVFLRYSANLDGVIFRDYFQYSPYLFIAHALRFSAQIGSHLPTFRALSPPLSPALSAVLRCDFFRKVAHQPTCKAGRCCASLRLRLGARLGLVPGDGYAIAPQTRSGRPSGAGERPVVLQAFCESRTFTKIQRGIEQTEISCLRPRRIERTAL